jgi:hypothetical protein
MELPPELIHEVFSLSPENRYELAHRLLDSIDDAAAAEFDESVIAELHERRTEMLRGEGIVGDWRSVLASIASGGAAEREP